jgi:hypothetical protein
MSSSSYRLLGSVALQKLFTFVGLRLEVSQLLLALNDWFLVKLTIRRLLQVLVFQRLLQPLLTLVVLIVLQFLLISFLVKITKRVG